MKEITYFSNEIIGKSTQENEYGDKVITPVFAIQQLKYQCNKEEFEYWLEVITKTYGKYGEVTHRDVDKPKTKEELAQEEINKLKQQLSITQQAIDFILMEEVMI